MPANTGNPIDVFSAVEELLKGWLKERRELLGKYTELAVALQDDIEANVLEKRQQALCQLLVDYVSAGHFEVYHELINEAESFDDGSCIIAEKLMPAIGDTTEVILAYEEKYSAAPTLSDKVRRDLSSLGEILESRFALEDQLIAGLHGRHRRQVEDSGQR
ncbi:MAG: Rsd/AlgQ family anti-sigma factor [Halioglobus sp.]